MTANAQPEYREFREKNPTFELKVDALSSQLLTPDPKGHVIGSMESGKAYGRNGFYTGVKEYDGLDRFPVQAYAVWVYLDGHHNRQSEGHLHLSGLVSRVEDSVYQLTDAGKDLAKPIVARGTWFVNELLRLSNKFPEAKKPKFYSLARILGAGHKSPEAARRRGYGIYQVVRYLIENPGIHSKRKLAEKLKIQELRDILNSLGYSRMIDYKAPQRDRDGRRVSDWREYTVVNPKQFSRLEIEAMQAPARAQIALKKIVDFIKSELPNKTRTRYTANILSERLEIYGPGLVSKILSFLERLGCLESEPWSEASANRVTELFWNTLLEPIGAIAEHMDPNSVSTLNDQQEIYQANPVLGLEHRQRQLEVYAHERSYSGPKKGEEVRQSIRDFLSGGDPKKLSHISQWVNEMPEVHISSKGVGRQLENLIGLGEVMSVGDGYYRLIEI